MADIAMCLDNACPSRTHCARHADSGTRPNPRWQTYSGFSCPRDLIRCESYAPSDYAPKLNPPKSKR